VESGYISVSALFSRFTISQAVDWCELQSNIAYQVVSSEQPSKFSCADNSHNIMDPSIEEDRSGNYFTFGLSNKS